MTYEPYDPLMASTEDRIAWALCQIIDDDAPVRWTRYRGAVENIVLNPSLMLDLQTLARRRDTPRAETEAQRASHPLEPVPKIRTSYPLEAVPTIRTSHPLEPGPKIRTRDIYFGHGHATPPGGYKREAIQEPLIPPWEDPPR